MIEEEKDMDTLIENVIRAQKELIAEVGRLSLSICDVTHDVGFLILALDITGTSNSYVSDDGLRKRLVFIERLLNNAGLEER